MIFVRLGRYQELNDVSIKDKSFSDFIPNYRNATHETEIYLYLKVIGMYKIALQWLTSPADVGPDQEIEGFEEHGTTF